jgi:hypothetical protein
MNDLAGAASTAPGRFSMVVGLDRRAVSVNPFCARLTPSCAAPPTIPDF